MDEPGPNAIERLINAASADKLFKCFVEETCHEIWYLRRAQRELHLVSGEFGKPPFTRESFHCPRAVIEGVKDWFNYASLRAQLETAASLLDMESPEAIFFSMERPGMARSAFRSVDRLVMQMLSLYIGGVSLQPEDEKTFRVLLPPAPPASCAQFIRGPPMEVPQ